MEEIVSEAGIGILMMAFIKILSNHYFIQKFSTKVLLMSIKKRRPREKVPLVTNTHDS